MTTRRGRHCERRGAALLARYFALESKLQTFLQNQEQRKLRLARVDGIDPSEALLEELPRHTVFEAGDTVVTSGFSAVFPPGLPVG